MSEQNFCRDCSQSHNCGRVYSQVGHSEAPSVVVKVIAAFLVPIWTLIAVLGVCEWFLADRIENGGFRTVLSFAIAAAVTTMVMTVVSVAVKSSRKR